MEHDAYESEFQETLDSLVEDLLLLDALLARDDAAQSPLLRQLAQEFFPQTHHRLVDYLTQHITELYQLHTYMKKAQGA